MDQGSFDGNEGYGAFWRSRGSQIEPAAEQIPAVFRGYFFRYLSTFQKPSDLPL